MASVSEQGRAPSLTGFARIAVKIGSALLVDPASGLRRAWLESLVADVAMLQKGGADVMIVSSGAIALGRARLGLARGALRLEDSQAAAAVGQIALAHAYQEALARHGTHAAQVLLTLGDTEERRRYLNARHTIDTLLKFKTVPVINENDTVATSEIRYGDNDRLAARVASMVSADCLVLLSDVDGLYTARPGTEGAVRVPVVTAVTDRIAAMAGSAASEFSRGGMVTKLEAGKIALDAGVHMAIASGTVDHPLQRLADGGPCTWFVPSATPMAARKMWIAGALEPRGAVTVDAGAATALAAGKSLLPAGVMTVAGDFMRGDCVVIQGPDGREIGRGLTAYDMADAARLTGRKSGEIAAILGYAGRTALIHRDDLVLRRG